MYPCLDDFTCWRSGEHNKPNSRSQDAIISKVPIIVTFSHLKPEVAKFDVAVKYVKINTGLSFEQNVMSLIP